jgi:hypothetical protein
MNNVIYAEFLFHIGSIVVYKSKTRKWFGKTQYYWKYMDQAAFSGPFPTIMAAMEHCMKLMNYPSPQRHIIVDKGNVIHVDFKTKKRIK